VTERETRTVTIETTGDRGDGIARVERGYVVIVPGSIPGDELAVEIEVVKENFAMAEIVVATTNSKRSLTSTGWHDVWRTRSESRHRTLPSRVILNTRWWPHDGHERRSRRGSLRRGSSQNGHCLKCIAFLR